MKNAYERHMEMAREKLYGSGAGVEPASVPMRTNNLFLESGRVSPGDVINIGADTLNPLGKGLSYRSTFGPTGHE